MAKPEESVGIAAMTLLLGAGSLQMAKLLVVPVLKEWVKDREAARSVRMKDGEKLKDWMENQISELKSELRETREDARQQRAVAETAQHAVEEIREEHEQCTRNLESLQRQVGDQQKQIDNLRKQLGLTNDTGVGL